MKINPVITKPVKKYFCKNTINAKHDRHMDAALLNGLATVGQAFRFPAWHIEDVTLTAIFLAFFITNSIQGFAELKDLYSLKKRAIKIKKHSH